MAFTSEELEAIRLADEEIDREIGDRYVATQVDHEISKWLDELAYLDSLDNAAARKFKSQKAYRAEHKEAIAAKQAAYYAEHKEEIAAKQAAYRARNREKRLAYMREYMRNYRKKICRKEKAGMQHIEAAVGA